MSKKKTVYSALPIVAAMYGDRFGIKIKISKDDAYTDGNTVTIPNIPEDYPNMDAVFGYVAHEAGHIRSTDFTTKHRWGDGVHKGLFNIIEDARIEQEMMKIYPGTTQTLNATSEYGVDQDHYEMCNKETPPVSVFLNFCLFFLRVRMLKQSVLEPYLKAATKEFDRCFNQGITTRLNALIRKTPDLQDTTDALDLTDQILTMLEEERDKENQANQSPSDQPNSSSTDQSSGSHSDDSGEQSDQGQQGQNSATNQDASTNPTDSQSGSGIAGGHDGSDGQSNKSQGQSVTKDDQADAVAKAVNQVLQAGDGDIPEDLQSAMKSEFEALGANNPERCPDVGIQDAKDTPDVGVAGQKLLSSVQAETSKIRTQLYGLVQAKQRSAKRHKRSGKRFDSTKLCKVVTGDTRVFVAPRQKVMPNTAVHILVDFSSSMDSSASGKPDYQVATEAALALSLALDSIPGVNPAVSYFCGSNYSQKVYSVVKHGQKPQSAPGKFVFNPTGSTPMHDGIWYSAYELSKTREDKKIMLVITDGEPNRADYAMDIIERCDNSDIEMIGVGIASASVSRLFDKHIVINDVTDLQKNLFKLMENALLPAA